MVHIPTTGACDRETGTVVRWQLTVTIWAVTVDTVTGACVLTQHTVAVLRLTRFAAF